MLPLLLCVADSGLRLVELDGVVDVGVTDRVRDGVADRDCVDELPGPGVLDGVDGAAEVGLLDPPAGRLEVELAPDECGLPGVRLWLADVDGAGWWVCVGC